MAVVYSPLTAGVKVIEPSEGQKNAPEAVCNLAGNTIDFHVQVLGLSIHDVMRQITGV